MGEGEVSKGRMTIQYKKEFEKRYLILTADEEENEFAAKMLSENNIPGLLVFQKRTFNGEVQYYYDVSGKHPLQETSDVPILSGTQIRKLLQSLYGLVGTIAKYFLEVSGIVLDMRYIYEEEGRIYFCYDPACGKTEEEIFDSFGTSLLEMVDHADEESIELGYCFYQMIKEGNKAILQILEEILSGESLSGETIQEDVSVKKEIPPESPEDTWDICEWGEEHPKLRIQKTPDKQTIIYFMILLLVSLGYLGYLFCLNGKLSVETVAGMNGGMAAFIFLGFSCMGIAEAFVDIDIKEKR